EADGGVLDSIGTNSGTVVGAVLASGGAVLDRGAAPQVVTVAPIDADEVADGDVQLELVVADSEEDEFVADFYLRQVSMADDFTIVVLPDTQYYSDPDSGKGGEAQFFHDQTQWIRDNRELYNIVGVIHNGDIVNHGARDEEWAIADAAMARLETAEPALPEGMPYGVTIGNHDLNTFEQTDDSGNFNKYFGVARFAGRDYYGGHYLGDNDENWVTYWAGGLQFVVVNLQWDETPSPAVLAWARSVFEAHPDAFGILNTHFLLDGQGEFGAQGEAIYEALKSTTNVHLMTCGHVSNEQRRTDVFQGHPIHTMLADYQNEPEGGAGYLRVWEFSPANDELTVRTYSPTKDMWLTEDRSEFTLAIDMPGAGGPFEKIATIDPAGSGVATTVPGLAKGGTYEWYAEVSDCAHTVKTDVQRFTTAP
ncbi:MAG TPA: metallophosphoesterase, partial [Nannocystaceae bacterium]|nr:metallophosphoesterase [Nannocystaceae bacterium]